MLSVVSLGDFPLHHIKPNNKLQTTVNKNTCLLFLLKALKQPRDSKSRQELHNETKKNTVLIIHTHIRRVILKVIEMWVALYSEPDGCWV